jgi:hypothetical protein
VKDRAKQSSSHYFLVILLNNLAAIIYWSSCGRFVQMAAHMEEVARKAQEGLLLLAELSNQAATLGHLGNLYTERYYDKSAYIDAQQTGIEWVMECLGRPRYFYKMFRMTTKVFMALHDMLVSTYGLRSTNNVSSVESLAMFLWIVGGHQSFAQAENHFVRSLWIVHMKF